MINVWGDGTRLLITHAVVVSSLMHFAACDRMMEVTTMSMTRFSESV